MGYSSGSEKVLIVAQGVERERILAAVSFHSPTKVIVLRNTNDVEAIQDMVENELKQLKVDLNTKSEDGIPLFPLLKDLKDKNEKCNFFDLCECITKVDSLIKKEKDLGATVVVDISSGPKVVTTALYIAAALNNTAVTYFIAGKYATVKGLPEQYDYSIKHHQRVPTLPLIIKSIPFNVLEKLASTGGYAESAAALAGTKDKKKSISIARHLRTLESMGYVIRSGRGYQISAVGKEILKLETLEKSHIMKKGCHGKKG